MDFYLDKDGNISTERVTSGAADCIKKLSIARMRDKFTGKERLSVKIYDGHDDSSPYATVYCSPLDLQRDLTKLREYGVVISRKDVMRIEQLIEKDYYKIDCVIDEDARTIDTDMSDLLHHICNYIRDKKIEAKTINSNELYSIPVNDFRLLFKYSPFSRYSQREIRRKLRDMGYTICSPGRYDYTVKSDDNSESIKVISLYSDDPDIVDIMQELNDV